jgi:D-methionine transport system ATP-binding protein
MLQLQQVSKTFMINKQLFTALQDVSLTIAKGDIFGIVGKSGAGKSTLLRCMNLLERPTQGSVAVDNVELTQLKTLALNQQRKKIGMIFQHFNLLSSRTVFENIALPLEDLHTPAEIAAKVYTLLKLVDLEDKATYYPDQLSGGQKQRVAIARALATEPALLLCDEPTSALDAESTRNILELLQTINRKLGLTLVLITHELDVVKKICKNMAVLDKGLLVETGSVMEIFTQPKSEISKRLIRKQFHLELPDSIRQTIRDPKDALYAPIIQLTFMGESSKLPVITELIQRFGLSVNILLADIENISDAAVGYLVCQIKGEEAIVTQALEYLHALPINIEVL